MFFLKILEWPRIQYNSLLYCSGLLSTGINESMGSTQMIDLRSDTATRPVPAMRWAMLTAEVGDDMQGEDPTVNRLEARMAEMFGKEAAVFACSGTQSNQMALAAHCRPGDELLINESGHIANFEAGGPAVLSGITVRTIAAPGGLLDLEHLQDRIRPDNQHYCRTSLLCLENTTNMGGGRAWPLEQLQRVSAWAREKSLRVHIDGARLFNAMVARDYSAADVGACCDTVSVCFSKGLGCPMGSILIGDQPTIRAARRARKMFGGALRQAGVVAATALYALDHHVDRLREDHDNARLFAERIQGIPGIIVDVASVETNMVFFDVDPKFGTAAQLLAALKARNILAGAYNWERIRIVTHLDVSRADVETVADVIRESMTQGIGNQAGIFGGVYDAFVAKKESVGTPVRT